MDNKKGECREGDNKDGGIGMAMAELTMSKKSDQ
jgi:hypothetical protein